MRITVKLLLFPAMLFILSCSAGNKMARNQTSLINRAWIAIEIKGKPLEAADLNTLPRLEISVDEMRYNGNDACNQYQGGITELDDQNIRFGIAAGTRMMCMDMSIPDLFNATLPEVKSWKVSENLLRLYDADEQEIMVLSKAD